MDNNDAMASERLADSPPAFLVLDTESVPDGRLLAQVKFPDDNLSPEDAVERAQAEARQHSSAGSDFLPVTFQYPVAVCVVRVGADLRLQKATCLDAPLFRPAEITRQFWQGLSKVKARLVTFNGRGFDLPLLELAAFRYGCCIRDYIDKSRHRYQGNHLDLMEWLTNFNAYRPAGGLNLFSKLLGKPGKMGVAGDHVYKMYRAGQFQAINDYCLCDTLDTYFVFLRTRVLSGDIPLEREQELVHEAKAWLEARQTEIPALQPYLANWGTWQPSP